MSVHFHQRDLRLHNVIANHSSSLSSGFLVILNPLNVLIEPSSLCSSASLKTIEPSSKDVSTSSKSQSKVFANALRHAGVSMAPQLSQKGGISPAAIAVSSRAFVCSFPTRFLGRRFTSSAMTASEVGMSLMSPAQVFDLCRPLPAGSLAGSWEKALISSSICRALGTGAGANFGDDMLTREAGREVCARENVGFGGADSLVGIGGGGRLEGTPSSTSLPSSKTGMK